MTITGIISRITTITGTVIMVMDTRNTDMATNTDVPKWPTMYNVCARDWYQH
jgi:hypothetical protein